MVRPRINRRQEILEALALMLETNPGDRITTAALAKQCSVSEAALYRHFPSKAKMFEGLIDFAEETVFTRITDILNKQPHAPTRCHDILFLTLSFVEKNPGFARLFVGDVLQGESSRLRHRIDHLLNRIDTQMRQLLREHAATQSRFPPIPVAAISNLLMTSLEGRMLQFVRSEFRSKPTEHWAEQWQLLETLFDE
ncbi:MAG TPA: nucleoid occlusion factor SlmA [Gammaproteobacteria bacterium]|nr:nucleoid occlusion factor SlmA [Gammaproteobacteria bacterium]|tara:strand:+ start:3811 stop:4398 length:588 start_codon:yes stop_codon:yes gene_type:complete